MVLLKHAACAPDEKGKKVGGNSGRAGEGKSKGEREKDGMEAERLCGGGGGGY
jgi:hypothetical protein